MDTLDLIIRSIEVASSAGLAAWAFHALRKRTWVSRLVGTRRKDDLDQALKLYHARIPTNERDSQDLILQWQDDVETEEQRGTARLVDYFLVAKKLGRVQGFLYAQYYPRTALLFVSYLVRRKRGADAAPPALVKYLLRRIGHGRLKQCAGIVCELAHPDYDKKSVARERRFRRLLKLYGGLTLKRLEFQYTQPRLDLQNEKSEEEPQILLYARTGSQPVGRVLQRHEVLTILDGLYNDWYADSYAHEPARFKEYQHYLQALFAQVASQVPESIQAA